MSVRAAPSNTAPVAPVAPVVQKGVKTTAEVQQPVVPVWVQYGGSFATGGAAILAASLATIVALRGISANRKNVVDQLDLQRELAARASWANVVSANRQRWIDSLRDDLAEFISADFVLAEYANSDESAGYSSEEVSIAKQRRRLMFRRIRLRINREKPDQEELWQAIKTVMPATGSDHRAAVNSLTKISSRLLRQEWLRVKAEASGEHAPVRIPKLEQLESKPTYPLKPEGD